MTPRPSLEDRFRAQLRELLPEEGPVPLLVAVSGGCDSVALLYLLRFCSAPLHLPLTVAHLDHAMRPGSARDTAWVRGLCAAWGLPLVEERLARAPRGETEARRARHAFLRNAARTVGVDLIATAHHADDQAETVLFRALRGTGLAGLAGMPARSASGIVRPMLPFWRSEIRRFARERGLRWRVDPSNRELGPARNRLRNEVLPLVERTVAPAARRKLVSLAAIAREAEGALEAAAERALRELVREEEGALVLASTRLRDYDSAVGTRVVRLLLRRFGVVPDGPGTRAALQFMIRAPSGRELQLPGGVRVRTELGEAHLTRAREPEPALPDEPVEIAAGEPVGSSFARIGGSRYRVEHRVGEGGEEGGEWNVTLPLAGLAFPLRVRGWAPGDRVRTAGGTKTLKKLFLEHRVPRAHRHRLPVLLDAAGAVLWVAGVPRPPLLVPRAGEAVLFLTIRDA